DQPGRHALERRPGGNHLDHLTLCLAHHVDSPAGHRAHKALALELGHGLPHRRAADAELLSELALVEPDVVAVAIDVHRNDRVLEGCIGFLLEARRDIDRRKRRVRQRRAGDASVIGHPYATGATVSATHAGIQYARSIGTRNRSTGLLYIMK